MRVSTFWQNTDDIQLVVRAISGAAAARTYLCEQSSNVLWGRGYICNGGDLKFVADAVQRFANDRLQQMQLQHKWYKATVMMLSTILLSVGGNADGLSCRLPEFPFVR
jgi:hypothetical protein